jgi:hypothetical protein
MNAPRDPWADFSAVFAEELSAAAKWTPEQMDAMADERDRREFCAYCGSIKSGLSCCGENHFMTGREFFNANGYWPGDY